MLNKVTKLHWLLVAVFAILLAGCSATPGGSSSEQSVQVSTTKRPAQYEYAIELMKRGQHDKAYGVFSEVLKTYSDADVYTNLAIIELKRKDFEKASENIVKSISINPKNAMSRNIKGLIMVYTGNIAEAEKDYSLAMQLAPDIPDAYLNMAILYDLYLNLPKKALPFYEKYKEVADNKANKDIDKWIVEVQRRIQ